MQKERPSHLAKLGIGKIYFEDCRVKKSLIGKSFRFINSKDLERGQKLKSVSKSPPSEVFLLVAVIIISKYRYFLLFIPFLLGYVSYL